MLSTCAVRVHTCFRRFERAADRIIGVTGPLFVALALILFSGCTVVFFDSVFSSLFSFDRAPVIATLAVAYCVYVVVCLFYHYYMAIKVPPGFPDVVPPYLSMEVGEMEGVKMCRKCGGPKPEDHHCPWLNQCVGLGNERHFVLFMSYLFVACFSVVLLGYPSAWLALDPLLRWPYRIPAVFTVLLWILALTIGLAMGVMASWQLLMVSNGETSVETHDNAHYQKMAAARGQMFVNAYDLGRLKNLEIFFNVGPGRYPYSSILIPQRIPPASDGWTWEKRAGMSRHAGVREEEELTDDEGE